MNNTETIREIVDFIQANGDRFNPTFYIEGVASKFSQTTVGEAIRQKGSLEKYFENFITKFKPERLLLIVKKANGSTSAGKSPRSEMFSFSFQENPKEITRHIPTNANLGNPNQAAYDFHLGILRDKISELTIEKKEYKQEAKEAKKLLRKIQYKHDTQEDKNAYKMKMAELEGKNSLAGVFKEITPSLKELAEDYIASKKSTEEPQTHALEGIENEKAILMIKTIQSIKDQDKQLSFYYDIFVRTAQLDKEKVKEFSKFLKELTPEADEILNQ